MTSGEPLAKNPCAGAPVLGNKDKVVPIIRLYGATSTGESVLTYVHGFTSYFYVALPQSTNLSDSARGQIRAHLDQKTRERARGDEKRLQNFVLGIDLVSGLSSIMGYVPTIIIFIYYSPLYSLPLILYCIIASHRMSLTTIPHSSPLLLSTNHP